MWIGLALMLEERVENTTAPNLTPPSLSPSLYLKDKIAHILTPISLLPSLPPSLPQDHHIMWIGLPLMLEERGEHTSASNLTPPSLPPSLPLEDNIAHILTFPSLPPSLPSSLPPSLLPSSGSPHHVDRLSSDAGRKRRKCHSPRSL